MRERPEDFLKRYSTTARHGFLPEQLPLQRLPQAYYGCWEELVEHLPDLIRSRRIRSKIECLPTLDTVHLQEEPEWQRAYSLLVFLTHAYIWGGERPAEILPPQITCPLLQASEHFGLPPLATYAALNLWNFATKESDGDLTEPGNLRSLHTFTGTKDEEWFYLISVSMEATGSIFIWELLRCLHAIGHDGSKTVLSCLQSITAGIDDLGRLLERMHEHCDPQVFYHNIRPLLAGSKGMAAAGLPRGVFYDEGDGKGEWRQHSGGSNAQSSLIQLLDIFLEVDHHATGDRSPSQEHSASKSNPFMQEMRNYMPRIHREFLSQIENLSNIKDYMSRPTTSDDVREAYNEAVAALVNMRDIHIRIVTRYIIMPSRSPPAHYIVLEKTLNLATASSTSQEPENSGCEKKQLQGTGGTDLIPFLKRTRDETRDATVAI
ncbi:indoleamine 2,3-dioxygenase [Exophiala viscosa]|uniref:Indoleamine 2,3-dioxygenase n=1 Tax=Exophiala viscosa TaxID=2486360 RepID=A0AAN6E5H7_9EURO|nr:indoleamine 2,3-dioxygenase [Exophiala viscosa]